MRTTLILLTIFLLAPLPVFAQHVHIPDPKLLAAIRDTLDLPGGAPLTQHRMFRLTELTANEQKITDLTGIGHAVNLNFLALGGNQITDLTPIAGLAKLRFLSVWGKSNHRSFPDSQLDRVEGYLFWILLYGFRHPSPCKPYKSHVPATQWQSDSRHQPSSKSHTTY